jgi:hypothetical protein
VELDSFPTFSHPLLIGTPAGNAQPVGGLALNTTYYWRVAVSNPYGVSYYQDPPYSFRTTTSSGVHEAGGGIPESFGLFQNYPNPFNPTTSMEFAVPRTANVRIAVYDALGRSVATLAQGEFRRGFYTAVWNGSNENGAAAPSGVYFARMAASPSAQGMGAGVSIERTIRMVLLK